MNEEHQAERDTKTFGQRVDKFLEELDEAGERLKKEFQDKYEELRESAQKIKSETKNKERWKEVEDNLTKAGEELKKAFEAAFRKRHQDK